MRAGALLLWVLAGCATSPATQGGARFAAVEPLAQALPAEALFGVCWPQNARSAERVALTFLERDVVFEVREGASNATGRCLREIAATYPWRARPTGTLEVQPPRQPIDGWAALAWVRLLSPSRYSAERGLVDPAPLAAACLQLGPAAGQFLVRHEAGVTVRVLPGAVTDAERCLEAVLGATAWPSTRELYFEFQGLAGAPAPQGEVAAYRGGSGGAAVALDPEIVRQRLGPLSRARVSACWELALARRVGLGGARSVRLQVRGGAVTAAWFTTPVGDGAPAADYLLDQCLLQAVRAAPFADVADGDGVYTWVFATRG